MLVLTIDTNPREHSCPKTSCGGPWQVSGRCRFSLFKLSPFGSVHSDNERPQTGAGPRAKLLTLEPILRAMTARACSHRFHALQRETRRTRRWRIWSVGTTRFETSGGGGGTAATPSRPPGGTRTSPNEARAARRLLPDAQKVRQAGRVADDDHRPATSAAARRSYARSSAV